MVIMDGTFAELGAWIIGTGINSSASSALIDFGLMRRKHDTGTLYITFTSLHQAGDR